MLQIGRFKWSHVVAGENSAGISTEMRKRNDFDRWLTGPDMLLRNDMGCKSYDELSELSRKLSVAENFVNGKSRNGVETFFENGDDFKTGTVYLLVWSNNTNELNNTETQYILNKNAQECANFGIASVKTKHCWNNNNATDNYRYSTPLQLSIQ